MAIGFKSEPFKPHKNKKAEEPSSFFSKNPKVKKWGLWLLIALVIECALFLGGIIMLKNLGL
jgi:hypothetical protein